MKIKANHDKEEFLSTFAQDKNRHRNEGVGQNFIITIWDGAELKII